MGAPAPSRIRGMRLDPLRRLRGSPATVTHTVALRYPARLSRFGSWRRQRLVEEGLRAEKGTVRAARTVGMGGKGQATEGALDVRHRTGEVDSQLLRPGRRRGEPVDARERRQATFEYPQGALERRFWGRVGLPSQGLLEQVRELAHTHENGSGRAGLSDS